MSTGIPLPERMKVYEAAASAVLVRRVPVMIRVDGRAFHSFTRRMACIEPFDEDLSYAMRLATEYLAAEMQGFGAAYHQSDEVSFLLTDYAKVTTEPWFGYNLAKLCSVSAALFTARFNDAFDGAPAAFDARAFNVPESDVVNYFLWRSRDWRRNSIAMQARAHFSHKELHGKSTAEMLTMLPPEGMWENLEPEWRLGSALSRDGWADAAPGPRYVEWDSWLAPILSVARGETQACAP